MPDMPATPLTTPRPAIFLDRDDTINRNADLPQDAWSGVRWGDLLKPEYALLVPGVREALIALKDAGYALVVITNQGGVARAGGTMRDVDACNDRMRQLLAQSEHDDERVLFDEPLIDCWYSCPFHPKTGVLTHLAVEHEWRKPHCGMITTACAELNLDPARSWMVGDKQRDLDAAIAAGVPESRPSASPTTLTRPRPRPRRTPDPRARRGTQARRARLQPPPSTPSTPTHTPSATTRSAAPSSPRAAPPSPNAPASSSSNLTPPTPPSPPPSRRTSCRPRLHGRTPPHHQPLAPRPHRQRPWPAPPTTLT
ncbi:MAG: HAD-IIIA family hydrolase [Phycisphaerales bacterium]